MSRDYYSVLGVSRDSNPEEIKRAYRKLALQYHPDKPTGNEEKFKEINEAYQVLGDPEKRGQYDRFGSAFEGAPGAGFAHGFAFDPFEIFQREFSGFEDLFGDLFGTRRRTKAAEQGDDRATAMTISFEEMVRGTKKDIALERLRTCPKCQGSGAEPGTEIATCATCAGTGAREQRIQTPFGIMLHRTTCPDCGGEGKRPKKSCRTCSGTGRSHRRDTLALKIPAGIEDGTRLLLRGEGESGIRSGPQGDLLVTIRVREHPTLVRDGNNLRSFCLVPFTTAALGGTVNVETIDGKSQLHVPRGTASGTEFRLRGQGIAGGDQVVTVTIAVPLKLTREQEELLKRFAHSEK